MQPIVVPSRGLSAPPAPVACPVRWFSHNCEAAPLNKAPMTVGLAKLAPLESAERPGSGVQLRNTSGRSSPLDIGSRAGREVVEHDCDPCGDVASYHKHGERLRDRVRPRPRQHVTIAVEIDRGPAIEIGVALIEQRWASRRPPASRCGWDLQSR